MDDFIWNEQIYNKTSSIKNIVSLVIYWLIFMLTKKRVLTRGFLYYLVIKPFIMQDIQKEIEQLKERNKRVESDKAWETSIARKIIIMLLTYIVIVIFLYTARLPQPWINAIIPTIGFMISTLGLWVFKTLRLKHKK